MAFPQYDIAERGDDKFVLARTNRDLSQTDADLDDGICEIMGVFDSEFDARIQLLRIIATPPGHPMVKDAQGDGMWRKVS